VKTFSDGYGKVLQDRFAQFRLAIRDQQKLIPAVIGERSCFGVTRKLACLRD
jgi:hypothetical protein